MTSSLKLFLYSISFNVIVQVIALLFSVFASLTHHLFWSVALLSLTVSFLSNWVEHAVNVKIDQNRLFKRYREHRAQIEMSFKGKPKTVYALGLIKVFRHGLFFEFLQNLSLVFKVFLFIPAYLFLSHEVQHYLTEMKPGFLFDIEPFGVYEIKGIRILPILMFVISVVSGLIYYGKTKGSLGKHVAVSLLFLVLLYQSQSILVVYWCLNITFSTLMLWMMKKE